MPITKISSGTLRLAVEYGLSLPVFAKETETQSKREVTLQYV